MNIEIIDSYNSYICIAPLIKGSDLFGQLIFY